MKLRIEPYRKKTNWTGNNRSLERVFYFLALRNLHTRHRLSLWFILFNCPIIVCFMTLVHCWIHSRSAVTKCELSRRVHTNWQKLSASLSKHCTIDALSIVLWDMASSNVTNYLFAKIVSLNIYHFKFKAELPVNHRKIERILFLIKTSYNPPTTLCRKNILNTQNSHSLNLFSGFNFYIVVRWK